MSRESLWESLCSLNPDLRTADKMSMSVKAFQDIYQYIYTEAYNEGLTTGFSLSGSDQEDDTPPDNFDFVEHMNRIIGKDKEE